MVAIDQSEADKLLAALRRTPVWQKHPQLDELFHRLNFKRFIANDDRALHPMKAAAALGGVCALARSRPPKGVVGDIVKVLDADRTYLLMTDTTEVREEIADQVETFMRKRHGREKPVLPDNTDIAPVDGAHRGLVIMASDWE